MIHNAEDYLYKLGFNQIRVRHHNDIARIEVPLKNIAVLVSPSLRKKILKKVKGIGYRYVTLDLQGYRTGSMNPVSGSRNLQVALSNGVNEVLK